MTLTHLFFRGRREVCGWVYICCLNIFRSFLLTLSSCSTGLRSNVQVARHITKTYLYNFDPLKPHFYIVKLGFTGVYIIFLISYFCEAVLTSTHNLCFEQKYEKYQNFYLKTFSFVVVKFSMYMYLNRQVFVMGQCFALDLFCWRSS